MTVASTDLQERSVVELLAEYRAILRKLRRRGVLRTDNAPTGDYAEALWVAIPLVAFAAATLGVVLQVLWEDRPITYPLSGLRSPRQT